MIKMTIAEASQVLGLSQVSSTDTFKGMSIDSRKLEAGNLFVAIPGEKVDGHDFTDQALHNGAAALLVEHAVKTPLPQLQVDDVVIGMGKLAGAWRQRFTLPIIAVTGSNGKTTLKNMIAEILRAHCTSPDKVLATIGTLNNHFGLPLSLSQLDTSHDYAVFELGMNHFGEIDYLTKMCRPKIAIITNAAASHLAGVGDVVGVARAKAEIFNGLENDGTAILNRDDAFYSYWCKCIEQRPHLSFGFNPEADIRTDGPIIPGQPIQVMTPKGKLKVALPLLGIHNAHNALAAIASAIVLDIPFDAIKKGLESIQPAAHRLELHQLMNGVKIIDDTYNANPFSLEAAIRTLADFSGKKILVLGDMKELGVDEKDLHFEAGQHIHQAGIDYLFTYGDLSANTAIAFGEGAFHFTDQDKLVNALKPFLSNATTILIKGSRSMKMENVVDGLIRDSLPLSSVGN